MRVSSQKLVWACAGHIYVKELNNYKEHDSRNQNQKTEDQGLHLSPILTIHLP
jgi:hypothetical protein